MTDDLNKQCCNCKFYYQREDSCKWAQWADIDVPFWLSEMDIEVSPYKDRHCSAYKPDR